MSGKLQEPETRQRLEGLQADRDLVDRLQVIVDNYSVARLTPRGRELLRAVQERIDAAHIDQAPTRGKPLVDVLAEGPQLFVIDARELDIGDIWVQEDTASGRVESREEGVTISRVSHLDDVCEVAFTTEHGKHYAARRDEPMYVYRDWP